MNRFRLTPLLFLALLLLPALRPARMAAPPAAISVPAGFAPLFTAPGITVYEELGNDANAEVFVQVVDLAAGARLDLLHGPIVEPGRGDGVYGGPNPRFDRQYMATVWAEFTGAGREAVCLVNGTYFRDTENGFRVNPTTLSFPLKRDGVVVSEGHDRYRFYRHRRMLTLDGGSVAITPLSRRALYNAGAPDLVVGLSPRAGVREWEELPRTFAGVADDDGDGAGEIVLLYSAEAATQAQATATLHAFGATEMMMLDGGGSAQLFCEGAHIIEQSRPLPQTIVSIAAPPPPPPPPSPPLPEWPHPFCSGWLPANAARIICR